MEIRTFNRMSKTPAKTRRTMRPTPAAPCAVIVHELAQARAALAAASALGVPVTLRSAPGAAAYAGAAWFQEMTAMAVAEFPAVDATVALDCGRDPGYALAALRQGLKCVRFDGPAKTAAKIDAIAGQLGAEIDPDGAPALDLLDLDDPIAACREWLGGEAKTRPRRRKN